jgi:hypothetical protein
LWLNNHAANNALGIEVDTCQEPNACVRMNEKPDPKFFFWGNAQNI